MLANDLRQQKRRDRGRDEGHRGQADRVREGRSVPLLAARKGGEESDDAIAEVERQAQHRANLDDDGEHLPVAVVETDVEERLRDAQMRRRADGEKLGEAFDDAEHDG